MATGPTLISPQTQLPGIGSFTTATPGFPLQSSIPPLAPTLYFGTGSSSPSSATSTNTSHSHAGYLTQYGTTRPAFHDNTRPPNRLFESHESTSHGSGTAHATHRVKRRIIDPDHRRLSSSSSASMSQYSQSAPRRAGDSARHVASAIITLPPRDSPLPPLAPSDLPTDKFVLHLRQQPRAARAGPDGKDRRTIDPPPVLQLLINDLDLDKDGKYLKDRDWVVFVKLAPAPTTLDNTASVNSTAQDDKDGPKESITRSLLGTMVSSPFYCETDPDPETAPKHPVTKPSPPPSPTLRFLPRSRKERDPDAHKKLPGAFFIFADLSVRKAGQFRLEFRLMKMEPSSLLQNHAIPTIATVVSDVFNVVNAKDFDQVQPSTELVKGLLGQGAGFPLKLKKGLRKTRHDLEEEAVIENESEDDES